MDVKTKMKQLLSLPKTLYFNFTVFPFSQAIKLPVYVDRKVKIGEVTKGRILLDFEIEHYCIKIGVHYLDGLASMSGGFLSISQNAQVVFRGPAVFSAGTTIRAIGNSKIEIGEDFFCNKNCAIVARESISIGKSVLLGWNVNIRDSDGETHKIFVNGIEHLNKKAIDIGNHVWICANSSVLKGASLGDDSVVAYNSCVVKDFGRYRNVLLGGSPASIIKKDVDWAK